MRGLLVLSILLVAATPCSAAAQVNYQLSGTIESINGSTLTLRIPPPPPRRVTLGESTNPVSAPPPTLVVDLEKVPIIQWVSLRPGDRIAVVGVLSADGRRLAAITILGGAGLSRPPEAP